MKKIFNLMVAAVALLGFVACEKSNSDIAGQGVSFYASIDTQESRLAMTQNGNVWNSAWEGDESLTLTADYENYYIFTNTTAEPNKFSCNMAGVEALKRAESVYFFNSNALNSVNSSLGADGVFLYANTKLGQTVTLTASSAMLHFDSEYYVTFEATDMFGDGNSGRLSEVTVAAGQSVFVPIFAGATTLSYYIGGKKYGSMELTTEAGKVYELGTLAPTENPIPDTPEQQGVVYLVANDNWKSDGAWFAAYFFNANGDNQAVKMTAEGDVYVASVPANMSSVIFCRMNPAYTEFSWNSETQADHVWTQTEDLTIGVAPMNYFYILGWEKGEWHEQGYVPTVVASEWSICGEMNGWTDTMMDTTAEPDLFVAKNIVAANAYTKFKVRKNGTWDVNFGGNFGFFEANKFMKAWSMGQDMCIVTAGTYDIYFRFVNDGEGVVYLVTAGADYTTATEQTKEGPMPSPDSVSFGLVGTHNNWGSGGADTVMTLDKTLNVHVAKNATLTGEFKVRGDNSWGAYNYGAASSGSVTVGKAIDVKNGSNTNLVVASGTYDVYFSYGKNKVWVMPVGQVPTDL